MENPTLIKLGFWGVLPPLFLGWHPFRRCDWKNWWYYCNNYTYRYGKYLSMILHWYYDCMAYLYLVTFHHVCFFIWSLPPGKSLQCFMAFSAIGEVVAHSGCPVVKGPPAPGWIGEWLLGIGRFQGRFQVLCDVVCVYIQVFLSLPFCLCLDVKSTTC